MKRGGGNNTPGVTIGAYPAHIGDPYDRKQEMLKQ